MSLKQNGRLMNQLPLRFRGGAILSFDYQETNKSQLRNIFANEVIDPINGVASGHLPPSTWLISQKSGGISSYTSIVGQGQLDGMGALGRNLLASISGFSDLTGTGALIVSAVAALSGSSLLTGNASAALELAANLAAQGNLAASIQALADGIALIQGIGSFSVVAYAVGSLEAEITPFSELSPESLAAAVWAANVVDNTEDGTMGNLLLSAGGGSSPEIIAAAVWDELMSTHNIAGTYGERVQKLLTLAKFIGLK